MGERVTRDGASNAALSGAAIPNAAPEAAGSLAAVRERLAGTEGLRAVLQEFHGQAEGSRLFEAALKSHQIDEKRAALAAELAEVTAVLDEQIAAAEQLQLELKRQSAEAYVDYVCSEAAAAWRNADAAFERQRLEVQRLKMELGIARARIGREWWAASGSTGPGLLPPWANPSGQWSRPSWYRSEAESPEEQELLREREQRGA